MEVQEVTVYLNNQQNEGAFGNKQTFNKDYEQPEKSIATNNDDLNHGLRPRDKDIEEYSTWTSLFIRI